MKDAIKALAMAVAMGMTMTAAAQQTEPADATHRMIVVSLKDRKLALVEDGQVKKIYTVAVGKPSTPSPVGAFTIQRRVANPTYMHEGKVIPAGPGNPVGTRWMGLSISGYGIHGTNEPKSIGKAASHGCIRMARTDLEELYPLVHVGDTVELIGEPNEETAQLFGGDAPAAPGPAAPALAVTVQPVVMAQLEPDTDTQVPSTDAQAPISAVMQPAAMQ